VTIPSCAQCEDAAAICVVFDVSNEQSFENCAIWTEEIRTRAGREHVRGTYARPVRPLALSRASQLTLLGMYVCVRARACSGALVANKTDLEDRVFGNARMRGQQFAQGYGLQYFETSAVRRQQPTRRSPARTAEAHYLHKGSTWAQGNMPVPIRCPWRLRSLTLGLRAPLLLCVQMNTEGVNEAFDSIAKDFAQSYVEYTRRLGA
jgi:hypothetical protein